MISEAYIDKYQNGMINAQKDLIIQERRMELFVNGKHYIYIMCLAQNLIELAVGFLFSEGLIGSFADVVNIESNGEGEVYVTLHKALLKEQISQTKQRMLVSGFGRASFKAPFIIGDNLQEVKSGLRIQANDIIKTVADFNRRSKLFSQTGAVHSSLLRLPAGIELFFEDIGRHNTVDKIIGQALISGLPVEESMLITSGRISSEMIVKAAALAIPAVISVSAPTDMAVSIAQKTNITLIGFARDTRFSVFAGKNRIECANYPFANRALKN